MRRLIVSTHFDDAALSAAAALVASGPQATVATVRGGEPAGDPPVSDWDASCGFASPVEAASARQAEDRAACAVTGASPVHLAFPDGPYGHADAAAVRAAIAALLEPAAELWLPAGIGGHPDHVATRDALLPLAASVEAGRVHVYADGPYAGRHGWDTRDRRRPRPWRWGAALAIFPAAGLVLGEPQRRRLSDAEMATKLTIVRRHASQLASLGEGFAGLTHVDGILRTEVVWPATG